MKTEYSEVFIPELWKHIVGVPELEVEEQRSTNHNVRIEISGEGDDNTVLKNKDKLVVQFYSIDTHTLIRFIEKRDYYVSKWIDETKGIYNNSDVLPRYEYQVETIDDQTGIRRTFALIQTSEEKLNKVELPTDFEIMDTFKTEVKEEPIEDPFDLPF